MRYTRHAPLSLTRAVGCSFVFCRCTTRLGAWLGMGWRGVTCAPTHQMAFNRAEKARTSRLSDACVLIQTAFRRHMFEHDYKVCGACGGSVGVCLVCTSTSYCFFIGTTAVFELFAILNENVCMYLRAS